ncbi:hypothetical protein PAHAL_1G137800 [Panicum hallii]|uniref:Receptor-like serine/threonine-protein kinase n=1 Tax=Panicum hallii TaxID=206008 RepID=A0A2S3GP95_9POAL|nr:hypothetical protein PAHAL_1G137800 [Panicum hallii]
MAVPQFTSAWVANRDSPFNSTNSLELTISHNGNLVVLNQSTESIIWSTQANATRDSTLAILSSTGNLILRDSSNSSKVFWQSFDHPTDTLLPGAKIGWNKITGLKCRLVSSKNSINPATGLYCFDLDPSGVNQILITPLNSSVPYWSSGVWNGKYFSSPETPGYVGPINNDLNDVTMVDNDQEKYFAINIADEHVVFRLVIDASGQAKEFVWFEGSQDWAMAYAQPKAECDVYGACGPFTICNDDVLPHCSCMDGFTVTSPQEWELDDRSGGCLRKNPLECISNKSTKLSTDKFYTLPCVRPPRNAQKVEDSTSIRNCAQFCLNNCSCTAYSFSNGECSIWHNGLLDIRQLQCNSMNSLDVETLYIRVSTKDLQSLKSNRVRIVIGVVIAICISSALIILLIIWSNKRKGFPRILNGAQGTNGIIAFRYTDLQKATKNFKHRLGEGSFGSVFKGFLNDSIAIAVKRLDRAFQGEKQFRAEVSSIGAVQHVNLVKLVGFCCDGSKRLLVYDYMSNCSLDILLFRENSMVLTWDTRYQIAVGVARGLAYLHESCRHCIIHCDIKPENILLDGSFVPKIADFGMAKIMGRDFSRALTTMRGTFGYLAPEWITGTPITPKVDVYSYGMVLLEIISGRRNSQTPCFTGEDHDVYFPVYVAHKLVEGDVGSLADHMLHGDINLDEVERACKVACWCIQDNEFDRPTMGEVVQILEGLVELTMPPMPRLLQAIANTSHSTSS